LSKVERIRLREDRGDMLTEHVGSLPVVHRSTPISRSAACLVYPMVRCIEQHK
jgi:hypothetical protein